MRYLCLSALVLLTACGNVTPLIKPSDIPAYEQKRKEKFEKFAPYTKDGEAIDGPGPGETGVPEQQQ